ncbi:MAG: peptidoglycan recognition protein [Actinomycetes bacterium]
MASPRQTSRARSRRALLLALVAGGLGLVAAVLPLPAWSFTSVSVGAQRALPAVEDVAAAELQSVVAESGTGATGDRVAAEDASVPTFTSIGLTFDRRPSDPVFLRTRRPDGGWDPWQVLPVSADEGPDGSTSAGTDPVWTGGAVGYEVNLGRTDAASADVVTVHDQLRRTVADATPVADAATVMPFTVHPRTEWGARASSGTSSYASSLKLAVVHHSASGNTYTQAEVPSVLRSIQAYHMDGRGWSDIAYNFVVDKFGTVWEGRGGGISRPVVGAHAMGFNTSSVGIMVLGDYSQPGVVPGAATNESVSKVIGWKFALHRIDPASRTSFTSGGSTSIPKGTVVDLPRVVGHKDVGATGCPGSIYGYLPGQRARAQEWTNWIRAVSGPSGVVETTTMPTPGTVKVTGFAVDPDLGGPARVRLAVAGRTVEADTSIERPDVQLLPGFVSAPLRSGFELMVSGVPPGWAEACTTVIDQGTRVGDEALGCTALQVVDPAGAAPTGELFAVSTAPGTLMMALRVADAQGTAPFTADVLVDGVVRSTRPTNADGVGLARIDGIYGGPRLLCLRARNVGAGADSVVDCRRVQVPGASPRGAVEVLAIEPGRVRVKGWVVDDESIAPTFVAVVVGPTATGVNANRPRPDQLVRFPGLGPNHGFEATLPAARGTHNVCVVAHNLGLGADTTLACTRLVVK